MGLNLKELWNGAKETVQNYSSAITNNRANSDIYTLEMRKKCLARGPIDSAAYRSCLSTQYLLKNPSSVIAIGSLGKVGAAIKAGSTAQKITQVAKAVPKSTVKNLPGLVTSIVRKEIAATAVPKGIAAVSPLLKTTGGKALAIAGGITGIGLVVTNALDFYNWNGPIQTALKKSFPWLYPVNPKTGKETVYPKIKKMTPQETAQLQELIYQATGQRLSGEQLRQAILERFGITVIEERPRKGESEGPLGTGSITQFQTSVKGSTGKYTIKAQPQLMIENSDQLQEATMNEVSAFIQALPGRMSFDYIIKPTYVDADGRRRKGNFAVVKVSIINKKGTSTEIAELPLGTVPGNVGTPTPLNGAQVAKDMQTALKGALSGTLLKSNATGGSKKSVSSRGLSPDNTAEFNTYLKYIANKKKTARVPVPGARAFGPYDVTLNWKYARNPRQGWYGSGVLAFNPDKPMEYFLLKDSNSAQARELITFLDPVPDSRVQYENLSQWFPDKAGDNGLFEPLFTEKSLEQLFEDERLLEITLQASAGQLSPAQADALANVDTLPVI